MCLSVSQGLRWGQLSPPSPALHGVLAPPDEEENKCIKGLKEEEQEIIPPSGSLLDLLLDLCFRGNLARPSLQFVPTKDFMNMNTYFSQPHLELILILITLSPRGPSGPAAP